MTATVSLIVTKTAPELERFAAAELKRMLERLFDIEARVADEIDARASAVILIGQPGTNSVLAELIQDSWPTLSDQGLLLRRLERQQQTLITGGGSAVATLWAIYELGERLGVRYLHNRDIFPAKRLWAGLPPLYVIMEPNLRTRCWRLINELPHGSVSWSLNENQRFLRQMAKMKFNRVRVQVWPAQPFVHYTIDGMPKPKGTIFFGQRYPIDDHTIGREHFGNLSEFDNPEFVGAQSAEDLNERATRLVRGIFDEARRLGMETALAFEPAEWPSAFQSVLPGTDPVIQVGSLTVGPGSNQSIQDLALRKATATVIHAYAQTYPQVDYLILSMPEHGHWIGHAREALQHLTARYDVQIDSFEKLCARALNRTSFPGGGERVERQLKNDLSSLWFFDSLFCDYQLLKRPAGAADFKLVYDSVTEELLPLVASVVPPGGEIGCFIDYTASRQLRCRELLQLDSPPPIPVNLILTLADDNVGVLPQLATGSIYKLMGLLREHRWSGFYTRYWTIGDLDPTIHLLARGSWDASFTPQDAYRDQVGHVCGLDAVEPALAAFVIIEKITLGLDQHGMGFAFPVPSMMTKHYDARELSNEIRQDQQSYREALRFMEQAHAASTPEGRDYTGYFVGRLRFAVRFLDAAELFGATARALEQGADDKALEHADQAYDAIREALQAYADVARDHGDLGSIAAINEYCYRPIRDKRNEIRDQRAADELSLARANEGLCS